jgi:hypothetical protein
MEISGIDGSHLNQVTQFMVDAGVVLRFQTNLLSDMVVLNPQWLADVMSSVVTLSHSWVREGVLVKQEIQNHVWKHK